MSVTRCVAVLARFRGAQVRAVFGVFHDRLVTAVRAAGVLDAMAAGHQFPDDRVVEAGFQVDGSAVLHDITGRLARTRVVDARRIARFLQALEEEGLSFEHLPSGVDNLSVVLREHELDDAAREWIAARGYDPKMGARPMARLIQEQIKRPLAEELLFGSLADGGHVRITVGPDDELQLNAEPAVKELEHLPDA